MVNAQAIQQMKREHDFLICIDSDGCVFDTMEIKHKECFIPNIINYWSMQSISKYAREAAEYVNLYSKYRGINRFPALIMTFDLLMDHESVRKRGYAAPDITVLRNWVAGEPKLGNPALKKYIDEHPDDALMNHLYKWSLAVNAAIEDMVHGVPPFPYVVDCLKKMREKADVIVVSQTPSEALEREWEEHQINGYVKVIAGQEMGTKSQCIGYAMEHGYSPDAVLMIGDAPGDYNAAKKNGCLFYPVNPCDEDKSWEKLFRESLDCFFNSTYQGDYEKALLDEFDTYLPSELKWRFH